MSACKLRVLRTALIALVAFGCEQIASAGICPEQIDTDQALRAPVVGATAARDAIGRSTLSYIEVFDGTVEEMASQGPTRETADGAMWELGKAASRNGFHAACHYSRTNIVLDFAIPPESKACVLRLKAKNKGLIDGHRGIEDFRCSHS